MTKTLSVNNTWWFARQVQQRLIRWTLALLAGRRYTVRLTAEGTGFHNPKTKVIQANPQMFSRKEVPVQFRATQGILAHEVGHALFTDAWPKEPDQQTLRWLVNALEDERIERAISAYYPGVAVLIDHLSELLQDDLEELPANLPVSEVVLACCLSWRWAYRRYATEPGASKDFLQVQKIDRQDVLTAWLDVKPLVEAAWIAPDTTGVIEIARQILRLLGVPQGQNLPDARIFILQDEGIPEEKSDETLPFPNGPCENSQPGTGNQAPDPAPIQGDKYSQPASYVDLEDAVAPGVRQLVQALKLPKPIKRSRPHDLRGRYTFRQELRTPETPNLVAGGVKQTARELAIYVLLDRSGSMQKISPAVRRAAMSFYLAAKQLNIPIGMTFFGGSFDPEFTGPLAEVTLTIASFDQRAETDAAKAYIAGFDGETGTEYLDWGLQVAEAAIQKARAKTTFLIVIHDGQPGWYAHDGRTDAKLSLARLQRLERNPRIVPIGIFLGDKLPTGSILQQLFTRLIVSSADQLPEKLSNILRSLGRR